MKILMTVLFLLVFGACGSQTTLSSKAQDVTIVHTERQVKGCTIVGRVTGMDKEGTEEMAHVDLRNNTAKMRADTVLIKETVQNGAMINMIGLAYRCHSDE